MQYFLRISYFLFSSERLSTPSRPVPTYLSLNANPNEQVRIISKAKFSH